MAPSTESVQQKKKTKKKTKKERDNVNGHSIEEVKTLGHQLLSSRSHLNNIPLLLSFVSASSPPLHAVESILSLQSFFATVLPDLDRSQTDPESVIYRTWLRSKFDDFIGALIGVSVSPDSPQDSPIREVVLDTLMEFVKDGNSGKFHSSIYHRFISATIVHSSSLGVDTLLDLLVSKYFNYIDVRYFTFITLDKLARTLEAKYASDDKCASADDNNESGLRGSIELSIHKMHHILSHIPPLDGLDDAAAYEMWNGSGVFVKENDSKEHRQILHKKQKKEKSSKNVLSAVNVVKKVKLKFTKAWISFLRLPLPLDVYKEVLVSLHQAVIPYLSNPIMLCDFLTRSYDIGGVISVMALSSLYILMTQHGLEYPNFYEKLYALLVPSIFLAKHRAKFFELLDSCLKSPLLPAYLAAAFAKKLSRLAISVPSSGELVIVALIHNLLRRHPSINCLVHQEDGDGSAGDDSGAGNEAGAYNSISTTELSGKRRGIDHFNNDEADPLKTKAMRSSLWEIDTLRHHYCPPISRFVLSLENDLTVRSKTTEIAVKDFSSGSYATIFGEEIRRRVKQVPLAFYKATPTSLFSESDFAGWTFKCEDEEEAVPRSKDNGLGAAKRQEIECS